MNHKTSPSSDIGRTSRKTWFPRNFSSWLFCLLPHKKKFLVYDGDIGNLESFSTKRNFTFTAILTFRLFFFCCFIGRVQSSFSPFRWNFLRFWRFYPATTSTSFRLLFASFDGNFFFLSIWSLRASKGSHNTFNELTFLYRVMTKFCGSLTKLLSVVVKLSREFFFTILSPSTVDSIISLNPTMFWVQWNSEFNDGMGRDERSQSNFT